MNFDTQRLTEGTQEVADLIENAEISGYNIIRCLMVKKRPHEIAVSRSVGGFEHLREGGILDRTYIYAYPDKKNNAWLFIVDSPHNRKMIKRSLASNLFTIVEKNVKDELVKECAAEGIRTDFRAPRNPYEKFSKKEENLTKTINTKDAEMLELKRKLASLENDKKALEDKVEKSIVYRENKDATTKVVVPTIDPYTDEVLSEEVEVEVQKTVDPTTVVIKKPRPAGKLSGVKAKKKTKK